MERSHREMTVTAADSKSVVWSTATNLNVETQKFAVRLLTTAD